MRQLVEPLVCKRMKLPCSVIRNAQAAVIAIGSVEMQAPFGPRGPRFTGILARRALERIKREFATCGGLPRELTFGNASQRIAIDGEEITRRNAIVRRQVGGHRLR